MDEPRGGARDIVAVGDPDAPRRRPPRWAVAGATIALGGAAVLGAARMLGDNGPTGAPPTRTPAAALSPYRTSGLQPPFDVHGPLEDSSPPPLRVLIALPDGSYTVAGPGGSERLHLGGEVVGALRAGAGFVVFDGSTVGIAPRPPGGQARTVVRTPWYVGATPDRIYVALRAGGQPVVRGLDRGGIRAGSDVLLPSGSLEPGGWLPRALVGSGPTVVLEKIGSSSGPGRDIGVLRPGGTVEVLARDGFLAGVVGDLVLTRRGAPDEAQLGVTRVRRDGLDQYNLALPVGWRLADGQVANTAGVIAIPVYAFVGLTDPAEITALAYATVTDQTARLVPGSYGVAEQAGLAGDGRHLIFVAQSPIGPRLAVWHPPDERSARYLSGPLPDGGRLPCRLDPQPCGHAVLR